MEDTKRTRRPPEWAKIGREKRSCQKAVEWIYKNQELFTISVFEKIAEMGAGSLNRYVKEGAMMRAPNQKKADAQLKKIYESLKKIYE